MGGGRGGEGREERIRNRNRMEDMGRGRGEWIRNKNKRDKRRTGVGGGTMERIGKGPGGRDELRTIKVLEKKGTQTYRKEERRQNRKGDGSRI